MELSFFCLWGLFVLCKPHFVVVSLWTSERHPNHNRHFVANQTCEYSVHHCGETSVWQCLPYEFTLTCPSGPVSSNLTCLDESQLGCTLSFILITIVLFRLSPSGQVCWKLTCLEAECTRHGRADECLDITRFAKQQYIVRGMTSNRPQRIWRHVQTGLVPIAYKSTITETPCGWAILGKFLMLTEHGTINTEQQTNRE